jgi:hypothetical protein
MDMIVVVHGGCCCCVLFNAECGPNDVTATKTNGLKLFEEIFAAYYENDKEVELTVRTECRVPECYSGQYL